MQSNYPRPNLEPPRCPKCGGNEAIKLGYIWWGGVLAAKLYNLHRCNQCKQVFNGTTGASARSAAIRYQIISGLIGLIFLFAVFKLVLPAFNGPGFRVR